MEKTSSLVNRPDVVMKLIRITERTTRGGYCLTSFPERNLFWSPGLFDLLELDHDVLPSNEMFNRMIHPDDRRSAGEIELSIASAMPYHRVFRLITAKNSLRWVSAHNEFLIGADGSTNCLISSMTDTTTHHQATQLLDVHRHRFKALTSAIASMGSVSWTARTDGYIERIEGWEPLTGQADHDSEGWGWLDRVHPDDKSDLLERWRNSLRDERIYDSECRVGLRDGSWMWVSVRGQPIKDATNKVIEWIGAATTIQSQRVWVVDPENSMNVTGAQLRAARGLLNWSVAKLAAEAGASCSAIRRLEEYDGVTKNAADCLRLLKGSLEAAGVEFVFPPNGKSGVRPR